MVIRHFIRGVYQRDTGRQIAECEERLISVTESFDDTALIRVLIMVIKIIHREAARSVILIDLHKVLD